MALSITFIAGACLLIGVLITYFGNNKEKIAKFAIGLSFSVLLGMIVLDLIPEMFEHLEGENIFFRTIRIIICLSFGFGVFKVLDKFIPHHHDHSNTNDKKHLFHIGIITSIVLILHNIIEGIAIYSVALSDVKTGLIMCLGVALHNIPLGLEIGSSIHNGKDTLNNALLIIILSFSSTFGALFLHLSKVEISDLVLGSLIAITLGMVLYLVIMELLKELLHLRNNKYALSGCLFGIIIVLISSII